MLPIVHLKLMHDNPVEQLAVYVHGAVHATDVLVGTAEAVAPRVPKPSQH